METKTYFAPLAPGTKPVYLAQVRLPVGAEPPEYWIVVALRLSHPYRESPRLPGAKPHEDLQPRKPNSLAKTLGQLWSCFREVGQVIGCEPQFVPEPSVQIAGLGMLLRGSRVCNSPAGHASVS